MTRIRVAAFSVSIDGFGAGPAQSLENPLGAGGMELHKWMFDGGVSPVDDAYKRRAMENLGAWIIGRNMFGPVRGAWPDLSWKGWWGETPPYHTPVYVLTHHARPPLEMDGGTTFHFVTDGIETALDRAIKAARGKDIRIGGGVSTIRQYLLKDLIDELHIAVAPALLGRGERLFEGIDMPALRYECAEYENSPHAAHFVLRKRRRDR